jgi:hypothetical protein
MAALSLYPSRTMGKTPTPWPAPRILDRLVRNSSGYFIYASTVVKFVDDEYSRVQTVKATGYYSKSPKSYLECLPDTVHVLVTSCVSSCTILPQDSCRRREALLGLEHGDIALIFRPLHSVLCLSSQIRVQHASFRDFLSDVLERSNIFYAGSPQQRARLLDTQGTCILAEKSADNRANLWF